MLLHNPILTWVVDGKRYMLSIDRRPGALTPVMLEQEVEKRRGDPYWRIMWERPDPIKPRIQKIIDAVLRGGK